MTFKNRGVALAAICLASFAINIDTTIVTIALPSLVRELDASSSDLQWIVDAYNLVFAALVLAGGSLGDRYGRKGFLLLGLGVFAVGSLAGALVDAAHELIAARAVMGLGAAAVSVATSRNPAAPPPDPAGLVLSVLGMTMLVFTIIEAPDRGWGSDRTIGGFVAAIAALALLAHVERYLKHPMIDIALFRNPRFSATSGAVAAAFFALAGFIFMATQYFQFVKGYGPLEAGVRLLPVALSVAASSVIGSKIAMRAGTRAVVATGLLCMCLGYLWISTDSATTSYIKIVGQMLVAGTGLGLSTAPATESIMNVVPRAKAGVGSAVNDATRLVGGTLGIAVIGSVAASIYTERLAATVPTNLPDVAAQTADDSVGSAILAADKLVQSGLPRLAENLHDAATAAFLHGFQTGCLVASGVALTGMLIVRLLLPGRADLTPAHEVPATAPQEPVNRTTEPLPH